MGPQDWLSTAPKLHSPTPGATVSIDPTISLLQTWIPAETENVLALTGGYPGQVLTLIVQTNGTQTYTLTFTTLIHSTGTLATGATSARYFVLTFVSNGIGWFEVSRTAAMA